ncbi:MAG: hypothetical protein ACOX7B_09840 [Christensenellales bacterium]
MQEKPLKSSKTLALYLEEVCVYRPESEQVSVFENESFFQLTQCIVTCGSQRLLYP